MILVSVKDSLGAVANKTEIIEVSPDPNIGFD